MSNNELNPLMYCMHDELEGSSANNDFYIQAIKILIEVKADLNITDNNGNSPLGVACLNGQFGLIKILMENNADLSFYNMRRESILLLACKGTADTGII